MMTKHNSLNHLMDSLIRRTLVEPTPAVKLTGDFNGGGRTDIALTGPSGWNTLPVAFSNTNGSFTVANTFIGDFATWAAPSSGTGFY